MTPRPGCEAGSAATSDLKSVGPQSQAMLAQAGITTVEQLRQKGSVAAYCLAKRANAKVSVNLLWGLESALTAEPWQQNVRVHRTSLPLAVEAHEKND